MIYNEFYENTGECETSFFLGCRDCKECSVMIYNKEVEKEIMKRNKEEQERLQELYGDIDFEVEEIDDPYWAQQALDDLHAECHEANMLRKALEELKEIDIIETAKSVVNKQIKEKMKKIEENNKYDPFLVETYESFFKIDLSQMTEEQIDNIDLTTYDCVPWG